VALLSHFRNVRTNCSTPDIMSISTTTGSAHAEQQQPAHANGGGRGNATVKDTFTTIVLYRRTTKDGG
jgi:hypothetical protein